MSTKSTIEWLRHEGVEYHLYSDWLDDMDGNSVTLSAMWNDEDGTHEDLVEMPLEVWNILRKKPATKEGQ